jgi:urease gamma subunit
MSIEEVRNQRGLRLTFSEAVAAIAMLVALFSALSGWIVLPEQVRYVREENARQDTRITAIESVAQERAETLARIDERTKRIEAAIASGR